MQKSKYDHFVSIIIPALNEEKCIGKCIKAIRELEFPQNLYETILVDNGSTDRTIEIANEFSVKVLTKLGGTIGALRNYGAQNARGGIIAFIDADCVVPNDWLLKALPYFQKEERIVLGFRLSIPDDSNWVAKCWDLLFAKRYSTAELDWIPTANMIITRTAFFSVSGFDERLESNEDYDFCFRMRNQGYKIVSCSDSAVVHLRPPQSLKQVFIKETWHGKNALKGLMEDVSRNKDRHIYKRKNFKVVVYALFYLICILFVILALLMALSIKTYFPLVLALICPVVASFVLAVKYTIPIKKQNMIFGMSVLLTVYGVARALSLINYKRKKK
jgi:cellulose synthase/poly-beta-1,6-N-acetylglucosamine synthase-like glycosyltransferase